MSPSEEPQPWQPQAVVDRVNRARGNYLTRTGKELDWPDFAKSCAWAPSTVTDVKSAKRPLRVAELGVIAKLLGVRPGYLAFNDGPMAATTPTVPATEIAALDIAQAERHPARGTHPAKPTTGRPARRGSKGG